MEGQKNIFMIPVIILKDLMRIRSILYFGLIKKLLFRRLLGRGKSMLILLGKLILKLLIVVLLAQILFLLPKILDLILLAFKDK